MKIKFIGATESVTGSKHLLITEKGKQVLLDYGLFQGLGKETDELNRKLSLNPDNIEAVILSHAHIDHSGNLPFLVKEGFTGRIFCTPATLDVCEILLLDSANIHENDVWYINKKRAKKDLPPIKPLYTVKDAEKCLKQFHAIPLDTEFYINDELAFRFNDTGHIIGSASVTVTANENGKKTILTYSGDVGRYDDALMRPPAPFKQSDYVICESTYGDRLHETIENSESELLRIVRNTIIEKKGKLIIPAFSLGRTQEIVYSLNKLKNENLLPDIKIFVDSPLSTSATDIARKHKESFNEELREYIKTDPDPFGFNNLIYIREASASKELNNFKEPCIIISASGMCDAGRVKHHLKSSIGNKKNTVLIAGYCAPNTLGAKLLRGEKKVHIYGDFFDVEADIESILSYSAHADYNELIKFLSCQDKEKVKTVYLVHGDPPSKISFKEKLEKEGFNNVIIPDKGETFDLN